MSGTRIEVVSKIDRAREHANQLKQAVHDFLSPNPFSIVAKEEPSTGDLVHSVRIREQPPLRLSLILADAVHNLRCSLDHLAWQLVLENGGTPTKRTFFPIKPDEQTFHAQAPKDLHGVSTQTYGLIKAMKPWSGGDDHLWRLHQLDVEDKHKLLITIGAAHRNVVLTFQPPPFPGNGSPPPAISAAYRVADRQYPLQDGMEVGRIMKAARAASDWLKEPGYTFEIAFRDQSLMADEPVIPTIPELIDHVEQACQPLLALLSN